MVDTKADVTLDAKGLSCPLPVLKTKMAIDGMQVGQVLLVAATDPAFKADIPALLKRTGHELFLQRKKEMSSLSSFICFPLLRLLIYVTLFMSPFFLAHRQQKMKLSGVRTIRR